MKREKNNKNLFINFHTWKEQEKQFGAINLAFAPLFTLAMEEILVKFIERLNYKFFSSNACLLCLRNVIKAISDEIY